MSEADVAREREATRQALRSHANQDTFAARMRVARAEAEAKEGAA